MLRKFSRMLAINMSTGSRTTRQVDYTHCKEAGRKQECGGSQEKLAKQSMAGSDAAEKLGQVHRGPVQAKQRELYSADEEEQGRAPHPCSELDGTWVGRAGCAQGQPERLAAASALSQGGVLGMFCIAQLGPREGITAPFLRMTKTLRDELAPARSHR